MVRRQPTVARLYHERGRLHLLLDDPRRAREDFARAILLAPNRGSASTLANDLIELGRLLHRQKEYAEAARTYRAVLEFRPDHGVAWRLLAEPLLALKRYDEAGDALDRYLGKPADRAPAPSRTPTRPTRRGPRRRSGRPRP